MTRRSHFRCTVCGSLRTPDAFGVHPEEITYLAGEAPVYPPRVRSCTWAGHNRISWTDEEPSLRLLYALLARYEAATEEMRALIAEAEGER